MKKVDTRADKISEIKQAAKKTTAKKTAVKEMGARKAAPKKAASTPSALKKARGNKSAFIKPTDKKSAPRKSTHKMNEAFMLAQGVYIPGLVNDKTDASDRGNPTGPVRRFVPGPGGVMRMEIIPYRASPAPDLRTMSALPPGNRGRKPKP